MLNQFEINLNETGALPYKKNATIYINDSIKNRAIVIYVHGGGLLYGNRNDLPKLHIEKLTSAGFTICNIDYPLSPQMKISGIIEDLTTTINEIRVKLYNCLAASELILQEHLPMFIWGRSAGAYLSLLLATNDKLNEKINGIISYYGYGFFTDGWYEIPSTFYTKLPQVDASSLDLGKDEITCTGPLETHYSTYVYARQQGRWKELFYEGRDKYFYVDYTLRLKDKLCAPLFAAHSTGDTDVPFQEFQALAAKYAPVKFVTMETEHDFDRNIESEVTKNLLDETVKFIEDNL